MSYGCGVDVMRALFRIEIADEDDKPETNINNLLIICSVDLTIVIYIAVINFDT
jgi:hypothetical protein